MIKYSAIWKLCCCVKLKASLLLFTIVNLDQVNVQSTTEWYINKLRQFRDKRTALYKDLYRSII